MKARREDRAWALKSMIIQATMRFVLGWRCDDSVQTLESKLLTMSQKPRIKRLMLEES